MAVDEALLHSASQPTGRATLRFYQWSKPTLSLGYFQHHIDRNQHRASISCDLIRRTTGGGAILHDQELTYSFTTPIGNRLSNKAAQFYDLLHNSLIKALSQLGVTCEPCSCTFKIPQQKEPFLCFQRRAPGDVICAGAKVGGSAQRRHRTALLQHGSVLLTKSTRAPELPGIEELTGLRISADRLISTWLPIIEQHLNLQQLKTTYSEEESVWAKSFVNDKFGCHNWMNRR
jgi:lipoate-protein ligase A